MSTNKLDRAFPDSQFGGGLNKREYFAALALEGLLADSEDRADEIKGGESCQQATARLAVEHADALIEELNK